MFYFTSSLVDICSSGTLESSPATGHSTPFQSDRTRSHLPPAGSLIDMPAIDTETFSHYPAECIRSSLPVRNRLHSFRRGIFRRVELDRCAYTVLGSCASLASAFAIRSWAGGG